jgi:hypothetical protein
MKAWLRNVLSTPYVGGYAFNEAADRCWDSVVGLTTGGR